MIRLNLSLGPLIWPYASRPFEQIAWLWSNNTLPYMWGTTTPKPLHPSWIVAHGEHKAEQQTVGAFGPTHTVGTLNETMTHSNMKMGNWAHTQVLMHWNPTSTALGSSSKRRRAHFYQNSVAPVQFAFSWSPLQLFTVFLLRCCHV